MARWTVLAVLVTVAAPCALATGIAADLQVRESPEVAGAPAALEGRWVVTAAERNGKPLDIITGGVMTVRGEAFEVRTASGNILTGTLSLDRSRQPAHMDLLHADGVRWEGIYEVRGGILRMNYVDAGGTDPRPVSFSTSAASEETLIVLRREDRP
jgi:uncharacterized protein (TIGR03067 family)